MIRIIAQKAVFGGECIGKIDGKTVFIGQHPQYGAGKNAAGGTFLPATGALPGESLEAEIVVSKKDYDKAVVKKIVRASEHRTAPFCPAYGICGGCNFQYADYAYQVELKKSIIEDLFGRTFSRTADCLPPVQTVFGPDTEYRSRFQFHAGGLKQRASDSIAALSDCPCAVKPVRDFLKNGGASDCAERENVFAAPPFCALSDTDNNSIVRGTAAQTSCVIELAGKRIEFDVNGFFQSNMYLLEKTLPLITEGLQGNRLLDMYGGTGVLSLFAAERFETVTVVESDKRSASFAEKNYRANGVQSDVAVRIEQGRAWALERRKRNVRTDFDALIVDPPRTGIEKEVLDYICTAKPPLVRYLSCNPATQARDLKRLTESGYTIEKLYMLDFYPHTSHIETLACLVFG